MNANKNQLGFGLVEVVIAIAIAGSFIMVLAAVNTIYIKISLSQSSKIQAAFLAEEGLEAMRFAKDESWDTNILPLTNGVEYYLAFTGTSWQATVVPTYVGIFGRRILLNEVYRDAGDDITTTGGTLDPGTRFITATVSWLEYGATSTKVVSTYITNLFSN